MSSIFPLDRWTLQLIRHLRISLKEKAYAYYASAGDDEKTKVWNSTVFDLVRFRPRILRAMNVSNIDRTILGFKSTAPFFISPAAMGKLAHPAGERSLANTARAHGIPYIVRHSLLSLYRQLAKHSSPLDERQRVVQY